MGFDIKKRDKKINFFLNKKGQVTIFIIIAILIVSGALIYFFLRGSINVEKIPPVFEPTYLSFLSCLEDLSYTGVNLLQVQAGYIYLPDFEPGSPYMPFSSHLNSFGDSIPYWYYVSGNNLEKEQVPTKTMMENQLERFINEQITNCKNNLEIPPGFDISFSDASSRAIIKSNSVDFDVNMDIGLSFGNDSVILRNHKISLKSSLGRLYDSAIKIYSEQNKRLFLEEYGLDVLFNYAPVDGIEISCSPLIWKADEVFDDLQEAIEANTIFLTNKGDKKDYFFIDLPVREDVRFLTSKNWPHTIEVTPSQGGLMVSSPIGNQQGLGFLGFCYVPYHYVYDLKYPVLVQVFSDDEFFQFPVSVIIKGNNPREPLMGELSYEERIDVCDYKNTKVQIRVNDDRGFPLKSSIYYECLSNFCFIGETSEQGVFLGNFPQCFNGNLIVDSEGFNRKKYPLSTISESSVNIVMDRVYEKNLFLKVNGEDYFGEAIIYFISGDNVKTILYPEQKEIELSRGIYEIHVEIFGDSEIKLEGTITETCTDIPRRGLLGLVGLTQEQCFEIEVPESIISQVLSGGGKETHYIIESDLRNSNQIEISVSGFPTPKTLEQVQNNNILIDEKGVDILFR